MRWPSWRFSHRFRLRTLVAYTAVSVLLSFVTGRNVLPPALRYTFYVVAGVGAGTWVLLSRRGMRPLARCGIALLTGAVSIVVVVGAWRINPWVGAIVFVVALVVGSTGYWTFARALDAKATSTGGYPQMLREAWTELKVLLSPSTKR